MAVAKTIGQRSLCARDQVGAVVVSAANRVIDTGYNGPPAGFPGSAVDGAWNIPCMNWCPRAAKDKWVRQDSSEDLPTIVDDNAFHGPQPDYSDCPALHAEANALMFGDRTQREGGTIYVTSGTCAACAKLVANSGLARAVYVGSGRFSHRDSQKWYDFMVDCGLEVTVLL